MAVRCILQHVGSMCLHQINNDLLHSPLGNCIVQQHSVDLVQLQRIYGILENAMSVQDSQTIICSLIVMQVRNENCLLVMDNKVYEIFLILVNALCITWYLKYFFSCS